MPVAIIFVTMLTIFAIVGVVQGHLLVKTDQLRTYASITQTEADNAIEITRRSLAKQIAEHVEVADVQAPGSWREQRQFCDNGGVECQSTVENTALLVQDRYLSTPIPSDTPVPCIVSPGEEHSINECNLSLGGELNEERRTVQLHTILRNSTGRDVAATDRLVRFRVFRLSPYVQLVGVRDAVSSSSVQSVSDAGGFDSNLGKEKDTLLRSYAPCRNIPAAAPTPISADKYYWGEWTNTGPARALQVPCDSKSGDTSHFQSGQAEDSSSVNDWGEHR